MKKSGKRTIALVGATLAVTAALGSIAASAQEKSKTALKVVVFSVNGASP